MHNGFNGLEIIYSSSLVHTPFQTKFGDDVAHYSEWKMSILWGDTWLFGLGGSYDAHFQINCRQMHFLGIRNQFVVVVVVGNIVCVLLLLIVVLAVQQAVPAVTGPGQRT